MIVECLSTELTPQQKTRLGAPFPREHARLLQVGIRYPVLGLQYDVGSIIWGTGAWVQLPVATDRLVFAPLYLFEVVDGRPSRRWETRLWQDGSMTLWPPLFYQPYFHGDLEARVTDVLVDFEHALELVLEEIDSEQRQRTTFVRWPALRRDEARQESQGPDDAPTLEEPLSERSPSARPPSEEAS